jgi:hypothetical protein
MTGLDGLGDRIVIGIARLDIARRDPTAHIALFERRDDFLGDFAILGDMADKQERSRHLGCLMPPQLLRLPTAAAIVTCRNPATVPTTAPAREI